MARRAFYSFHYEPDNWRVSQVRNMGVIDGNKPATDNDWETVKKGGDTAIKKWIDNQLLGKTVAIVLIGKNTSGRKWIDYEIEKAWDDGKGVLGIYIHQLKDSDGYQTTKGSNPFNGTKLSNIVKAYDSQYSSSKYVYDDIKENMEGWIETAIAIRAKYA